MIIPKLIANIVDIGSSGSCTPDSQCNSLLQVLLYITSCLTMIDIEHAVLKCINTQTATMVSLWTIIISLSQYNHNSAVRISPQ